MVSIGQAYHFKEIKPWSQDGKKRIYMIDGNMHPNYGAAGVLEEDCIELDRYGVELPDELFEL